MMIDEFRLRAEQDDKRLKRILEGFLRQTPPIKCNLDVTYQSGIRGLNNGPDQRAIVRFTVNNKPVTATYVRIWNGCRYWMGIGVNGSVLIDPGTSQASGLNINNRASSFPSNGMSGYREIRAGVDYLEIGLAINFAINPVIILPSTTAKDVPNTSNDVIIIDAYTYVDNLQETTSGIS